jgi:hypothetical protein
MMGNLADCGSWGWGMMATGGVWIVAFSALVIWAIVKLTRLDTARDGT